MAAPSTEGKRRTPNWDDLRFALALAQTKKAAKAAEALGVDSSTVLRRVAILEQLFGVSLFRMEGHEYIETEEGKSAVRAAERMAAEVRNMEGQLADVPPLTGALRIMMPEDLATGIFDPSIAEFCRSYPGIRLNLIMQSRNASLSYLEADGAVQMMPPREAAGEQGKKLCDIAWSCYATPSYLEREGQPVEPLELRQHVIIAPLDRPRVWRWLQKPELDIQPHLRSTSLYAIRQMALYDLGIAILPYFVGEIGSDLIRLFSPIRALSEQLWIVSHQDLRRTARVQAFFDIFGRLEPEVIARVQIEERLPPKARTRQRPGVRGIAPYVSGDKD